LANPDERCVPLFMGLVDDHMGWGIFQLFEDVFRRYPQEVLTPHLQQALAGASRGGRWWAAHWALDFPSPDLTPLLSRLLLSTEDADAHYFTIAALGEIYLLRADPEVLAVLRERADVEQDAETRELLVDVLLRCERA
jgi:HEAT repeats